LNVIDKKEVVFFRYEHILKKIFLYTQIYIYIMDAICALLAVCK